VTDFLKKLLTGSSKVIGAFDDKKSGRLISMDAITKYAMDYRTQGFLPVEKLAAV
jgi:hypothetical protein